MAIKGIVGIVAVSAILVPGTIYVAKPELFGLGETKNETVAENTNNTHQASNPTDRSGESSTTKPIGADGDTNSVQGETVKNETSDQGSQKQTSEPPEVGGSSGGIPPSQ